MPSGNTELEQGPTVRPRLYGHGVEPNVVDDNWLFSQLYGTFQFHLWTASEEAIDVLWYALSPLVTAFNGLWQILYGGLSSLTTLATLVGTTFLGYWNVVLLPLWVRFWSVLSDMYDLFGAPLGTALQAVQYLVEQPFRALLDWVGRLLTPFVALFAVLRAARPIALAAAAAGEALVAAVETRARDGFAFFVERYNEATSWLNHLVDEDGYLRPLTLVWSLWTWSDDIWRTILNALAEDDVDVRWAETVAAWPLVQLGTYLQRFGTDTMAAADEVDAALARFRSSGL